MGKIALGTVQFGMDYGISNKRGKVPKKEVFQILDFAQKNDINILDTAYNYGDSEKLIGEFIRKKGKQFKIISKLPGSISHSQIDKILKTSLENLNIKNFYAYLIHDFKSFTENPKILEILKVYKTHKAINKLGFSLYYPEELEYLLKNKIEFDIVQVPFNLFDQRFEPYFKSLKEKGVEVHTRSVFLQGLFFKEPRELGKRFLTVISKISKLQKLAKNSNLPISALCLNFALLNNWVDHVIIGVDSFKNLAENLVDVKYQKDFEKFAKELRNLKESNEQIIIPSKWT